jgi:hypothetical protein
MGGSLDWPTWKNDLSLSFALFHNGIAAGNTLFNVFSARVSLFYEWFNAILADSSQWNSFVALCYLREK